jgi:pimeloyl-ACP methyl ester carboxylesterase
MQREMNIFHFDNTFLEYSMTGSGVPIMLFHGGHSNCLEEFGYPRLVSEGFSIITPSRAGYGRTSVVEDLDAACHIYKSLLDHLNIEKVHVIAVSAGGPTGIVFSSMFPERVASLTLQCAVTQPWLAPEDKEYKMAMRIFHPRSEARTWKIIVAMSNLFPHLMFRMMASSFSTLPYSEIRKRLDVHSIEAFRNMNNRQRSYSGFLIDLKQTQRDYSKELAAIQARTLIIRSQNDSSVPLSHLENAKALIPRSEIVTLDSWGHLIWIGKHANEYDDALISFLRGKEEGHI